MDLEEKLALLYKTIEKRQVSKEKQVRNELEDIFQITDGAKQFLEFIRVKLNIDKFHPWQQDFMLNIISNLIESLDHDQYIQKYQLVGAYGVGKSFAFSCAIVTYMLFCYFYYPDEKFNGVMFSGNEKQTKQLWRTNIQLMIENMSEPILLADASKIYLNPRFGISNNITFEWRNWTESTGGIAGMHGKNVLVVFDEATEFPQYVYRKVETYFTSCKGLFLTAGNPCKTTCEFYRLFRDDTLNSWRNLRISRYDVEDVANGMDSFSNQIAERHGIDVGDESNGDWCAEWREKVAGKFTLAMSGAIFPQSMVDAAIKRHGKPNPFDEYYIGVDFATKEGNDTSVIIVRSDTQLIDIYQGSKVDSQELYFHLLERVKKYKPTYVAIDSSGCGYEFCQRAASTLSNVNNPPTKIIALHGAQKATNTERFFNRITQCYYNLRDWLKFKGGIPDHHELIEELSHFMNEEDENRRQEYKIDKERVKSALGRSPDIADALAYSCVATFHADRVRENIEFQAKVKSMQNRFEMF